MVGASKSFKTLEEVKAYLKDMKNGFKNTHPFMTDENRSYWRRVAPKHEILKIVQTEEQIS